MYMIYMYFHCAIIHLMYLLVCMATCPLTSDVQVVLDADEVLELTLGLQKTVQAEYLGSARLNAEERCGKYVQTQ